MHKTALFVISILCVVAAGAAFFYFSSREKPAVVMDTAKTGITSDEQEEETSAVQYAYGEAHVEEVAITLLDTYPVRVRATVRGTLPDTCTRTIEPALRRENRRFDITLQTIREFDALCAHVVNPFERLIAFNAVGMEAGTYTLIVNGVSAEFELEPEDVYIVDTQDGEAVPPLVGTLCTTDAVRELFLEGAGTIGFRGRAAFARRCADEEDEQVWMLEEGAAESGMFYFDSQGLLIDVCRESLQSGCERFSELSCDERNYCTPATPAPNAE